MEFSKHKQWLMRPSMGRFRFFWTPPITTFLSIKSPQGLLYLTQENTKDVEIWIKAVGERDNHRNMAVWNGNGAVEC